jgi:hypothetical protein
MEILLTDIPNDILIDILGYCWTCGPKRTCRKFSDLYDVHKPNKLFHCVISDVINKPIRNIPMDTLQFIFDTDKKTFDEIIAEDLKNSAFTYCFDVRKMDMGSIIIRGKNRTNLKFIDQVVNKQIMSNQKMNFEYVHRSLLSDAIYYQKNGMALYVLKLLLGRQFFNAWKYANRLEFILINSLALGNDEFCQIVLDLAQERLVPIAKTSSNTLFCAVVSLLLVKNDKISIVDIFDKIVSSTNILQACVATNAPMGLGTLHNYFLNKLSFT